jgi:UDP-glucose 4-epimerase
LPRTDGKTHVVFGGNGFIGSHLFNKLNNTNQNVISVSRSSDLINGNSKNLISDYSPNSLNEVLKTTLPDVVFLTYGPASIEWEYDLEKDPNNVNISTEVICDTLLNLNKTCKLFLISSAAVYGQQAKTLIPENSVLNPSSMYGKKKLELETIVGNFGEKNKVEVTILRVFSTFGCSQKRHVVWDMYSKLNESPNSDVVFMGDGSEKRDFLHIDDLIDKILKLSQLEESLPRHLNVGSGISRTMYELASNIKRITKSQRNFRFSGISDPRNPVNLIPDLTEAQKLGLSLISEEHFKEKLIQTLDCWDSK